MYNLKGCFDTTTHIPLSLEIRNIQTSANFLLQNTEFFIQRNNFKAKNNPSQLRYNYFPSLEEYAG